MSDPCTIDAPPKRRRWLRYSLRSLLVMVAILCVLLAIENNRVRRQRELLASIEQLGGDCELGYRFDTKRQSCEEYQGYKPDWFIGLIGQEYFVTPVAINFGKFRGFSRAPEQSADIRNLDLAMLANTPRLHNLLLGHNLRVTDAGLKHLQHVPHLWGLDLSSTSVTGSGFFAIPPLEHLEALVLEETPFDDTGMKSLVRFRKLRALILSHSAISEDGLAHLQHVPSLELVELNGLRLTDAGLAHFKRLASLKGLILDLGDTTPEGRAELQAALPNCAITWSP